MKYNTEIIAILKKDFKYYEKDSERCYNLLENENLDEDEQKDYYRDMLTSEAIAKYIRALLIEIE